MTSLPPVAGGPGGDAPATTRQHADASTAPRTAPLPAATTHADTTQRSGLAAGPRPLPPVRASNAPVELTLDLRATPPDKVLARLFGALERVAPDVTLLVLLRDTPEYAGVTANAHQALRSRGYASDTVRLPTEGQRLRVWRRREAPRTAPRFLASPEETDLEPVYAPPPASRLPLGEREAQGEQGPEGPEGPEGPAPGASRPGRSGYLDGEPADRPLRLAGADPRLPEERPAGAGSQAGALPAPSLPVERQP